MASELASNAANDCAIISYDELATNVDRIVLKVLHFAGIERDSQADRIAQDASQAQAQYRPKHQNLPLTAFGLSEDRIRSDLGDTIEAIGIIHEYLLGRRDRGAEVDHGVVIDGDLHDR
jgi:hypothetical protein